MQRALSLLRIALKDYLPSVIITILLLKETHNKAAMKKRKVSHSRLIILLSSRSKFFHTSDFDIREFRYLLYIQLSDDVYQHVIFTSL